jgi:hypothetical protein
MGWSSEVYVHYKDGVYYVGVRDGEQECDHMDHLLKRRTGRAPK